MIAPHTSVQPLTGKLTTAAQAVALIADRATVAAAGFVCAGHAEVLSAGAVFGDRFVVYVDHVNVVLCIKVGEAFGFGLVFGH
ncbi:MAG TPA: hypothetical protein VHX44_06625, partial [Planctomycetota bacterium]|nr:hypothetical protein [Planctomycetota bacterium]